METLATLALPSAMLAVALFLGACWQTAPARLRALATGAGALAVIAALSYHAYVAALAALAATGINAYRLRELAERDQRIRGALQEGLSLDWLRPFMTERRMREGEVLFYKNDRVDGMYFIVEGTVQLPEIDITVGPGQILGEIAVFSQSKLRTMTAQCEVAGKLLFIAESDMLRLCYENPTFGLYLIQLITSRLTQDLTHVEATAVTDALTGVPNRRAFDEALYFTWQRTGEGDAASPVSLIIADIDYFKRYNDAYGHLAGDSALQRVANALTAPLPTGAVLARYGGEEFAAILPDVDRKHAIEVAESMRAAVRELAVPHTGSPFGIVTVSLGVATRMPSGHDGPIPLVDEADSALYVAKNSTRDAVSAHDYVSKDIGHDHHTIYPPQG